MITKKTVKQIIPEHALRTSGKVRYGIKRASLWPAATFHKDRKASIRELGEYNNINRGKRCFVIGNGPSLNTTDLSKLENEYTFGLNRIYLKFPELGFSTTYYVSVNSLVVEQCARDILQLSIPRFISWRSRNFIDKVPDLMFLHTTYTGPTFARDIRKRLWEGATVTYVALQVAYYMGFDQVILIGVDHNFSTKGEPNKTVTSQGDDPDHFDPRYFGKGFRWQLPDLDTSEIGFRMAKQAFTDDQRQIIDATVGGKLTIFDKVDYNSLFQVIK